MTDRHYLLRVMALSAIPRIITAGLSLASLPLMVRALGASEYGVVVYLTAITAVLESFVDCGISSAAGKAIAAARETHPVTLPKTIRTWGRLQLTVALLGLAPLLFSTYVVGQEIPGMTFSTGLLALVVMATWITIPLNFIRASLTSMLAFRSLATLDAFESILRSAGWLAVAYAVPTKIGLAVATLFTGIAVAMLGMYLLWRVFPVEGSGPEFEGAVITNESLQFRNMIDTSGQFLWLRLGIRVFQSIPIIAFGRLLGAEVVGIVGAFSRVAEQVNFPFAVIGNALAVRAPGVIAAGHAATRRLWDVVSRFLAIALMLAVTTYLAADLLAQLLLPTAPSAAGAIKILAITVLTGATSSLIPPMSDYIGALKSRNVLLTVFVIIQIPAIWVGANTLGQMGAIGAYVAVLVFMNVGYVRIALSNFFREAPYVIPSALGYFLVLNALALLITVLLRHLPGRESLVSSDTVADIVSVGAFWSCVFFGLLRNQAAKRFFFERSFFDFQVQGR